jgi:rhamnosyltransferase
MTCDYLDKQNLCGIVVIYNPDETIMANIASYINQLSHLYIVDNSEESDDTLVNRICAISNSISYHKFGENRGIATALNEGCKLGSNDGYKWILTMDQDSFFDSGEFFESIFGAEYPATAIIAASYNHVHFKPAASAFSGLLETGFVITSGNVLNLTAWLKSGGFMDKLFIDEVDNEFCIRAGLNGYKILTTKKIYLRHHLGQDVTVSNFLTGQKRKVSRHSPLRVYYVVRNNLYLWRKFAFSAPAFVINRLRNIVSQAFKIFLYFPDKKNYLRFILKAVKHALTGRYGKFSD